MSGTTRTVQQGLDGGSIVKAIAMTAIFVAAVVAAAWGTSTLTGSRPGAAPAPAPLSAPAVRDLGSRDLGASGNALAANPARDLGSRDGAANAFNPGGFGPSIDQLIKNSIGSSQGTNLRHHGPRAQ
jgi:hypothetical protein